MYLGGIFVPGWAQGLEGGRFISEEMNTPELVTKVQRQRDDGERPAGGWLSPWFCY